jgi:hypothetical protein
MTSGQAPELLSLAKLFIGMMAQDSDGRAAAQARGLVAIGPFI